MDRLRAANTQFVFAKCKWKMAKQCVFSLNYRFQIQQTFPEWKWCTSKMKPKQINNRSAILHLRQSKGAKGFEHIVCVHKING